MTASVLLRVSVQRPLGIGGGSIYVAKSLKEVSGGARSAQEGHDARPYGGIRPLERQGLGHNLARSRPLCRCLHSISLQQREHGWRPRGHLGSDLSIGIDQDCHWCAVHHKRTPDSEAVVEYDWRP
jgi:hypothetical protein